MDRSCIHHAYIDSESKIDPLKHVIMCILCWCLRMHALQLATLKCAQKSGDTIARQHGMSSCRSLVSNYEEVCCAWHTHSKWTILYETVMGSPKCRIRMFNWTWWLMWIWFRELLRTRSVLNGEGSNLYNIFVLFCRPTLVMLWLLLCIRFAHCWHVCISMFTTIWTNSRICR